MVSLREKRNNNVCNEYSSSDEDSDYELISKTGKRNMNTKSDYDSKGKPLNRNALMARENRRKKKMYMENLETTIKHLKTKNKNLSSILDNQSSVIKDLRKEVTYLKSIVANNTDITRLLKCINQNTGLPVTSSINNNIINETITSKPIQQEPFKPHPWAEGLKQNFNSPLDMEFNELYGEFDTSLACNLENDFTWNDLFSNLYSLDSSNKTEDYQATVPELSEHNYTTSPSLCSNEEEESTAGVCLHIARHKISLEFCASCSENAATAWSEV